MKIEKNHSMKKLNNARLAILGLLQFRPMHGYELKKTIEREMAGFWTINYGSIYPELKKLEEGGFIRGKEESMPGKPSRKVFAITDKGIEEFKKLLLSGLSKEPVVKDEFNLYAAFFDHLPEEEVKTYIKQRKERHRAALKYAINKEKNQKNPKGKYRYLASLTRRFICHLKAELEWLTELEEIKGKSASLKEEK
jgi:DNA-binding PadR family transcriptional regulator